MGPLVSRNKKAMLTNWVSECRVLGDQEKPDNYTEMMFNVIFFLNFSWPCLHQWLETRPNRQTCPVCKAGISKDKVVPIYGRGCTENKDPR